MSEAAEGEAVVCNVKGLHARAAARFAEAAAAFPAAVSVTRDDLTVGGTSLMALLMLGAGRGTRLRVSAEGERAEEAVRVLVALVEGGFGEGC